MRRALTFLSGKTLYTGESYPYKAKQGSCQKGTDYGVKVKSYLDIEHEEEMLKNVVGKSTIHKFVIRK